MDAAGFLQIIVYFLVLMAITPLLGGFMARLFQGERVFLTPVLGGLESLCCRISGNKEQSWQAYAASLLLFNFIGLSFLFGLLSLQVYLPLNPQGMENLPFDLAFNTAVSFVTNTNWQNYGGEATLGYLVQMLGLAVQNFLSAATGIVVAIAFIRGLSRKSTTNIGNFYVDMVRCCLYLLLPLCLVGAVFLISQGVPQNFNLYVDATTLEGSRQTIAQGPVASQMIIKHLGTNGGGFFNANAAHPYENPSPFVNYFHLITILAIGAGLTNTLGRMVGDARQGWVIFSAMAILLFLGIVVSYWAETRPNPALSNLITEPLNMEGKEVRFGLAASSLFAVITTAASCGAVNAMHDSLMPLAGMVSLINMMLGEIIIGGVGAGLYGMLVFVLVTLFIAGLMVGRTPEYLGKKIEAREIWLCLIAIISLPLGALGLGAIGLWAGSEAITAPGPHGLSELVYAYVSATANNGSAFGGFSGNSLLHNLLLALAMLIGRFAVIIPALAIAGSLARKKKVPPSAGTFPTHGGLFVGLLLGVILIVGGLTFFPLLALGPVVEHFSLFSGQLF